MSTTAILAVVAWLFRALISARLTKSIGHEFNEKLEKLKADLRDEEAQIGSLRSGAMSGLISRQGALYERKIVAIDQLWSSVREIEKGEFLVKNMSCFKFKDCAKKTEKSLQARGVFDVLGGNFDITELDFSGAARSRPFLTPLAWAYYSTYKSIIFLAHTKISLLKSGVEDAQKHIDFDIANNLLRAAIPLRGEYIDENGSAVHHVFLDKVKQLLLVELQNIQSAEEADKENTGRAKLILSEVDRVNNESGKDNSVKKGSKRGDFR